MRILRISAATLLIALAGTGTACGQSTRPGEADAAVGSAADPDSVRARADRSRSRGDDGAPLLLIEVSDFQCPFCAEFARSTYPRIDSAFVATGRVRMLYIHLPLASHPHAFRAAEAAMCAGAQDRFWQMHDRVFATQAEWSGVPDAVRRFERLAQDAGVDLAEYRDCMANGHTASLVVGDALQAAQAGIGGTPTFFLHGPGGQRALSGALPFDELAREIEALLAASPAPEE
jgi:protein-disulfide isomerase